MRALFVVVLLLIAGKLNAQSIVRLPVAKFATGDNAEWASPSFNDSAWAAIKTNLRWEPQGYNKYNGYAWYRFHFTLPSSLKDNVAWKDSLTICLSKIDDVDEAFLNGVKIGQTGSFPTDATGYKGQFDAIRLYNLPLNAGILKWDEENIVAVRVFDNTAGGGIWDSVPYVKVMEPIDAITVNVQAVPGVKGNYQVSLVNQFKKPAIGTLTIAILDEAVNKTVKSNKESIQLTGLKQFTKAIAIPGNERRKILVTFVEQLTGKTRTAQILTPYILTPLAAAAPRINNAGLVGIRSNTPFLLKIAATGEKPLQYAATALPRGLQLDKAKGIITGQLTDTGNYKLLITVTNNKGKAEKNIIIKVGDLLALTPPMGWNSWNCWGPNVSEEKVKSSVNAMLSKRLADHGWNYINIDEGWNAAQRTVTGGMAPNEKFTNLKALGDWLHANGLHYGIYTSPGPIACNGHLGSYEHEKQDVDSFASWGVDYIKYDWCSYEDIAGNDTSLAMFQKPYLLLQKAIQAQQRSMVYSLCQYGLKNVWNWGAAVGGNCWRTTHDIRDNWKSISTIMASEAALHPYAGNGHWNDPDILAMGMVGGWTGTPRTTLLTPDEQYTHMSMWCLLAAPLLIGCDISQIDDFTMNLLSNDEVLAIDQDVLGKQAILKIQTPLYQVWEKALSDGSKAIGIVNLGDQYLTVKLTAHDLQLSGKQLIRDLWRQKSLGELKDNFSTYIPPHGITLVKITAVAH